MYRLVLSSHFKKNLRDFLRQHHEIHDTVFEKIELLQKDPRARSLRTHKLTGKLKDSWALSITYEYRLVFDILDQDIHLLAIGTHDEVY